LNFNFILLSLFVFSFFGCGVKQKPLRPVDTLVPSYIQTFTPEEKAKDQKTDQKNPQSHSTNP
jgi:predicted small lipoprotein YifL